MINKERAAQFANGQAKKHTELQHKHFLAKVVAVLGEEAAAKFSAAAFYEVNSAQREREEASAKISAHVEIQAGAVLRHDHFMTKVVSVLGEEGSPKFRDTYISQQNNTNDSNTNNFGKYTLSCDMNSTQVENSCQISCIK